MILRCQKCLDATIFNFVVDIYLVFLESEYDVTGEG